ncbi:MAG TPA: hypothetical protein VFC74_06190 [Oscillospiraceae bacterium]|nr:hypothetical protein [Oscillospiraceae bacterium]
MPKAKSEIPFSNNNRFYLELMLVLVIIILIIALAAPFYNATLQLVRDRVDEANIRILNSATLQWLLADEANDPQKMDTLELQAELINDYLLEWPISPNSSTYQLEDGQWIAK